MVTHVIRLTNGTEISSGSLSGSSWLQNVEITRMVNTEDDIRVGSVCAASMTAKLLTPGGSLSLNLAEESAIRVYSVDENGVRHNEGQFILAKPERTSQNTYKLTAYDNISKLDLDLSSWINGLTGWPFSLYTFAAMVCTRCGVTLTNASIPNGTTISINRFTVQAVTGRQLMQWIAEMCAMFCRATLTGNVQLAWYETNSGVSIAPQDGTGAVGYKDGSLSYEDYSVAVIDRTVLYRTDGTTMEYFDSSFTGDSSTLNSYTLTENAILNAISDAHKELVLQTIYNRLHTFTYTPCKVKLWAGSGINAGDIVSVTDVNGETITTIIMSMIVTGMEQLESTGSASRESPEVINSESYQQKAQELLSNDLLRQRLVEALYDELQGDIICKFG